MARIYLDYHATTPVDPAVLEAMWPYFGERFGNPASSSHAFGWEADDAVEHAREAVARLLGASPREIVWTSGATEATNLALKGVAAAAREKGRHIVTTAVEHPATLDTCEFLRGAGFEVTVLPVDSTGRVDPTMFGAVLRPDTVLASVIHANNEIGTLQPLAELGRLARTHGVLFHVDAAQSFGKVPLDVEAMGIDLLSISGHKIYAPKGVGALYLSRRQPPLRLAAQVHGGGQERGLRSGTLNVPGIVGLGKAAEIAQAGMMEEGLRLLALRDRLHRAIAGELEGVTLNGHPTERLPGNLNLSFAQVSAEALVAGLGDLAVSSASACHGASMQPSHVLRACGVESAQATLRFGLGRFTTEAEIDEAAARVVATVRRLRAEAPVLADTFEK